MGRSAGRRAAINRELDEVDRGARRGQLADLVRVDVERRRWALYVGSERHHSGAWSKSQATLVVTSSTSYLTEDYTERVNVGEQVELFSEEDLWAHVAVRSAERQTFDLIGIPGCNSCKPKVGDLESSVRGDEEVLSFQVSMNAPTGV